MRYLYLGDIVGSKTALMLKDYLPKIRKDYNLNLVFANAENVSNGLGLTKKDYDSLIKAGIDGMSMGNHTFSKSEIKEYIDEAKIARPANIPTNIGKRYLNINYNNKTITIINLLGRVFQNSSLDCPFKTMDNLLKEIKSDYIIVDIHAEATSEKLALAHYLDGRVNAIFGTHTHVQTADEQILENKTVYITDLGMTGPKGILGSDTNAIINRFLTGVYEHAKVALDKIYLEGVIVDTVKNTIERFRKEI